MATGFSRPPAGQPRPRGKPVLAWRRGPRSPQGHTGAGADLTRGGTGGWCGVQEASRAGSGGCGRYHSGAAESGTQHNGDGGAQAGAEEKPAVSSPAVPELPGPDSRTDAQWAEHETPPPAALLLHQTEPHAAGAVAAGLRRPVVDNLGAGSRRGHHEAKTEGRAASGSWCMFKSCLGLLHHLEMGITIPTRTNYNKNTFASPYPGFEPKIRERIRGGGKATAYI